MIKWVGLIVAAGIAISAGAASAQGVYPRGGYGVASDFDAPYAALPPEVRLPPRVYGPRYGERSYEEPGYAPAMLPPTAVYGILRDRGYSSLGIPQQRGFVYTISVISPEGDDGRLVIDARSGRILRFMPAYRMGNRMGDDMTVSYGPASAPPPIATLDGPPRLPAEVPRTASRTPSVPLPKPPVRAVATPAKPVAPKSAAAPASKPADAQASIRQPAAMPAVPASPPAVIEAKPSTPPSLQPTQDMPAVQGLE